VVDFAAGPAAGTLDVPWVHGVAGGRAARRRPDSGPPIQVHAYDEHTYVLRQNKTTHYEAPFLFLLMGNDRAVLLDTGATSDPAVVPLRATVDGVLAGWLARNPRDDYPLVVAHTHSHGDHVAGDTQFADRPLTATVGTGLDDVTAFFGFLDWPGQVVGLDLGGRVLDVTGIPGHHPTSIAVFDPWTGFLLTGDTVYPGRLYAHDMPRFVESLDRLVGFAAQRPVRHVLGCHIEMTRAPGRDYPIGTRYQPDEPPLPMTLDQLRAVRDAAHAAADRQGVHVHDDFVVCHLGSTAANLRLLARSLRQRLTG
jgi:glyoxylase-like metal-dependent hydrolase (beta-lactamase superfamily II)